MKWKKDNKLPNTKNVRRKTNPAGVTTSTKPGNKVRGKTQNSTSPNNNDKRKNQSVGRGEMEGLGENMLDMTLTGGHTISSAIGGHSHAHPMAPQNLHHPGLMHGDPGMHIGGLGSSLAPLSSPGCGQPTPQPVIKSDYGLTAL